MSWYQPTPHTPAHATQLIIRLALGMASLFMVCLIVALGVETLFSIFGI